MIMGLPGETARDLDATLGWFKRLRVDNVKCVMLYILPGSLMYRKMGGRILRKERLDARKHSPLHTGAGPPGAFPAKRAPPGTAGAICPPRAAGSA